MRAVRHSGWASAGVAAAVLLTACSGDPGGTRWDRATFVGLGYTWPLTVNAGYLDCDRSGVTFQPDGSKIVYAVNGTAKGMGKYVDLDPIWAAQADDPSSKQDVSDLIQMGQTEC